MNNEEFNNTILDRIRIEHVHPRSRWYFVGERWLFMVLIVLATIIGSIAVTTSLFILTDHDWFVVDHLEDSLFIHIIKTIPYLWLGIIVIVIGIVYFNVKKIGRGYRYTAQKIIAISLCTSIIIGIVLFFTGAGNYLDQYFDTIIPSYRGVVGSNEDVWIYPEDGLLSGQITDINPQGFTILDEDTQSWVIHVTVDTETQGTPIIIGGYVKIIGSMIDGGNFNADTILPWSNERNLE